MPGLQTLQSRGFCSDGEAQEDSERTQLLLSVRVAVSTPCMEACRPLLHGGVYSIFHQGHRKFERGCGRWLARDARDVGPAHKGKLSPWCSERRAADPVGVTPDPIGRMPSADPFLNATSTQDKTRSDTTLPRPRQFELGTSVM
jgi:hypothetical protein